MNHPPLFSEYGAGNEYLLSSLKYYDQARLPLLQYLRNKIYSTDTHMILKTNLLNRKHLVSPIRVEYCIIEDANIAQE